MKIICKKNALVQAVANVSRAVNGKSALPILEGILLCAKGESLSLTGYDLDLGITTSVEASVMQEGSIVLSSKLFVDMVRKMPGEEISISADEKNLTVVSSGLSEFTILGMDPSEYPELPAPGGGDTLEIDKLILQSMIDQTLFAIATTDTKPAHTGSLFEIGDGELCVVSVDGYRLALRREKIKTEGQFRFIVPGKTLSEVSKLIGSEEGMISISLSQRHIVFSIEGYQIISRLLEGDFLDYKTAIPKSHTTEVTVSVRSLMDSIERTSLLITDRLKSPLKIRFATQEMSLSCETSMGKAQDEIPSALTGDEVTMGFNNRYLLDALRNSGCDEVKLQMNGAISPMKVVPVEGTGFLFLVLPVRLKAEG